MTRVVVIGGFLGAGKTTLMLRAAGRLAAQGKRVGLVTNDQAPDMVDTRLVRLAKFSVAEVYGGCVCCRFNDFTDEIGRLARTLEPEVLFVEPVGSCVDLAATVLRPLARYFPSFSVCPLTTVVDPAAWLRLKERRAVRRETAYIYQKQLAEADIVLLNKSDIISRQTMDIVQAQIGARLPRTQIISVSAQTGSGMARWQNHVLANEGSGKHIDVNYAIYGKGEQCLGWLNAVIELQAGSEPRWEHVLREFMRRVCGALEKSGGAPAHLKCLLSSGSFIAAGNATLGSPLPRLRVLAGGCAKAKAELVVNLRIALPPRCLRPALSAAMKGLTGIQGTVLSECSFAPGRPAPQHRIA
jgi:Ni2+-binding GTPase involved in maturation of urease and hydrogenase